MTYPDTPIPPWTPEMQVLWDRSMLLERTRGAYGCAFPVPGTNYRPPSGGSMLHTILFVATNSPEVVEQHRIDIHENMVGWKERVRNSGKNSRTLTRHEPPPSLAAIDLTKLEFKL